MKLYLTLFFSFVCLTASAQTDRGPVRSGNKAYSKGELDMAEVDYRRALERAPGSVHASYNLGNVLYKKDNPGEAEKIVSAIKDSIIDNALMSKVLHNLGNYALAQKNYSNAIEYYKGSLRINPDDDETRSNLAYAQKMLKNEEDQKNNRDQNKNDDKDQNQDQKSDNSEDEKKQDNNQNQPPPSITPQAAQQMLQAIQNKERETQERVNKEKAKSMQRREKEKNW